MLMGQIFQEVDGLAGVAFGKRADMFFVDS